MNKTINILVWPRAFMEETLRTSPEIFHNAAAISIYSSPGVGKNGGIPVGVSEKIEHGLDICFDDVTWADNKGKFIFTDEQVTEIVDFINKVKDNVDTIVCQCDAGISRSGAVGLFAVRYLEQDEVAFREEHKHIRPNSHVLDRLMDKSGLKGDYFRFWMESLLEDHKKTLKPMTGTEWLAKDMSKE